MFRGGVNSEAFFREDSGRGLVTELGYGHDQGATLGQTAPKKYSLGPGRQLFPA